VGNVSVPYSDYGSLGQYYISGSVVPTIVDTTPPTPVPTLFAETVSRTTISMSATESVDNSGVVEYQFICSAGGQGCVTSDWQAETNYAVTGLASNTEYSYQVKARDAAGNETSLSGAVIMATDANYTPMTLDDLQIEVIENTATTIDVLANDTDFDGDSLLIDSFSVSGHGDVIINANKIVYTPDSGYVGGDSFSYTVSDGFGGYSTSAVDLTVIATNTPDLATVPEAPTTLSATLVKTGKGKNKVVSSAELNWLDNSNNETNFVIEHCLAQTTGKGKNRVTTCDYSEYSSVGEDVNNAQVSTESGYKYRVKATNEIGSSSYTNEVSILAR